MPTESTLFEIVFRGDVVTDNNVADVKGRLQTLFKADASRIDRLFSGRPVVIRSGLDQSSADGYQQALLKAGAIVQVREVYGQLPTSVDKSSTAVDDPSSADSGEGAWRISPVGSDVLHDEEKHSFIERNLDTSGISLAPSGTEVLKDDERAAPEENDVDTSHLSVK